MTKVDKSANTDKKAVDVKDVKSGQLIRVHLKIKETNSKGEEKERIQIYEGIVIGRRGGNGINAMITVRKVSDGIGVERIFPLHSPVISKIEVVKEFKTNRAQLPYLRSYNKKMKERSTKK